MVETKNRESLPEKHEQEMLLNRIVSKIRQSLEITEILQTTVEEIRMFLDADRVKIYKFAADGSGATIAESIKDRSLPSLVGLHFPAEDIPSHARERFIQARQRVIVDVASGLKITNELDSIETNDSPITEDVRYSRVDPCHAQYLTNMGVSSSLVLPILYKKQLWGLLACHQKQPKNYSERELTMVQLVVDQLSIAIAQSNLLGQAKLQAGNEAILNKIGYLLHSPKDTAEIRQTVLEEITKALNADGGRLYITKEPAGVEAQIYTAGVQPNLAVLEETDLWESIVRNETRGISEEDIDSLPKETILQAIETNVAENDSFEQFEESNYSTNKSTFTHLHAIGDIYEEPELESLVPAFGETKIRSITIVPLKYQQQSVGCLTLFRNEVETDTLWAGKKDRDRRNRLPRRSFEAWREIKRGQTQPWTAEEIKLAKSIGIHLYLAIMQSRVEAMLRHQASHDPLTGLTNRVLFNEQLSFALASSHQRGEMLAVMFLDLDGFKQINDTLGHAAGDLVLKNVGDRLKGSVRDGDNIARWGGDEFTFLITKIDSSEDAAYIARELLESLEAPFHLDEHEFYIKGTLGIAVAPHDGIDAETLLKNADASMHRAKQLGKNQYQFYTTAIGDRVYNRMVLENNLYKALYRDEFRLHYQPQVDLETGKISGMEALIRWQHPERGLISPYHFISIAEESGLICRISEWVLETACSQNSNWQQQGFSPITMAVNFSARQFQQETLVKTVAKILQATKLQPECLELEVTETAAMQDMKATISILRELQGMGIKISLDDFGTGYSSLWTLKKLPLNKLKIDKSFIRDAIGDSNDMAIIRAIISMGHELGLKVVAEGVETKEQLELLRSIKCDAIQGYFFSRPLPADLVTQLLSMGGSYGFCPIGWRSKV
ncbi:MAG: EAL domain-containing protein [Cyanobacteriota bacterium]|nr:EAL domain-containing protein [Cyanobacteriota bacterium]